jgi:hypothetical protein
MAVITEEEKLRRRQSNEDVIGTSAMEGQFLDESTLSLMHRFEEGELDREQLSAAIHLHVQGMLAARHSSAPSAANAA